MDKQFHIWLYKPNDVSVISDITGIQNSIKNGDEIINIFHKGFSSSAEILKQGYKVFIHFNPYSVAEVIIGNDDDQSPLSVTQEMICYRFVD